MTAPTPGQAAYEPGPTAYNLWVDVMITNGVTCDPFDTLGNVEQMAWREIGAKLAAVHEGSELRDMLDEATRTMLNLGTRPAEINLAHRLRKQAGLAP